MYTERRISEREIITTIPTLLFALRSKYDANELFPAAEVSKKIGQILGMYDRDVVNKTYEYLRNNDVLDFQRSELPNGKPALMISGNQIYAFGAIILTVRDSLTEAKNSTMAIKNPWKIKEKPKINWHEILPAAQKSLIDCGVPELAELIVFSFPEPREKPPSYKVPDAATEEVVDELPIPRTADFEAIAQLCTTGVIRNALEYIKRDNDSIESDSQEIPAEIAMLVTTIFQSFKERKIVKLRSEDVANLTVG